MKKSSLFLYYYRTFKPYKSAFEFLVKKAAWVKLDISFKGYNIAVEIGYVIWIHRKETAYFNKMIFGQ